MREQTSQGTGVPEAAFRAVGLDPATDDVTVVSADRLPPTLAMYQPTFVVDIHDEAAAARVGRTLARSLSPSAEVMLVTLADDPPARSVSVGDLADVIVTGPTFLFAPASDVRVDALGALYAADVLRSEEIDSAALSRRAAALAIGTWRHRNAIDALIDRVSSGWRVDRMNAVDRNIIRLGAFELRYTELPKGIAITEAVEIAKRYSTARSSAFVNGVLDAIADLGPDEPEV
ncbi:MAG TPA: transcription antitermination factor NusB [Acidimicrobiia bacterium]|nr:transcription antitermination factor NusB [Acidimicrobiia bacterium]